MNSTLLPNIDVKVIGDSYLNFAEMIWPQAGKRLAEIEHRLRYFPQNITRQDQMVLASVAAAYRQMVTDSNGQRAFACEVIREHSVTERD